MNDNLEEEVKLTWSERLKQRAKALKAETYALYLAYREPGVPWYAKAVAICVVAFALSPIDPIPDFIPVLGYLDDLIFIPLGVLLAVKLIPPEILADCRQRAREAVFENDSLGRKAAAIVVMVWLFALAIAALVIWKIFW